MTGLPDTLIVWPFIAMAFIAATNDIAIDGHYMGASATPSSRRPIPGSGSWPTNWP